MLSRRALVGSLISLVAAPAIVRVSSIMPVKAIEDWRYAARVADVPFTTLNGTPIYMDLVGITRKAFVPRLFVQIYDRTPLLYALSEIEHG